MALINYVCHVGRHGFCKLCYICSCIASFLANSYWFVCLLHYMTNHQFLNSNRKKKRGQRAVAGDKSGRGLRQFSMKGAWTLSYLRFLCCFCPFLEMGLHLQLNGYQWKHTVIISHWIVVFSIYLMPNWQPSYWLRYFLPLIVHSVRKSGKQGQNHL